MATSRNVAAANGLDVTRFKPDLRKATKEAIDRAVNVYAALSTSTVSWYPAIETIVGSVDVYYKRLDNVPSRVGDIEVVCLYIVPFERTILVASPFPSRTAL